MCAAVAVCACVCLRVRMFASVCFRQAGRTDWRWLKTNQRSVHHGIDAASRLCKFRATESDNGMAFVFCFCFLLSVFLDEFQ